MVPEKEGLVKNLKYPLSVYIVSGSQAEKASENQLYMIKMSNLNKTKYDDDSDVEELSDDDNEDLQEKKNGDAEMNTQVVNINASINRIRCMNSQKIVATWNDFGEISFYNFKKLYDNLENKNLDKKSSLKKKNKIPESKILMASFKNSDQGFALDWSPLKQG